MAEETQTFPTLDPTQRRKMHAQLLVVTIGCAVLFAFAVFVATTIPPLASHLAVALLAFRPRLPVSPVLYRALAVWLMIGGATAAVFGAGVGVGRSVLRPHVPPHLAHLAAPRRPTTHLTHRPRRGSPPAAPFPFSRRPRSPRP